MWDTTSRLIWFFDHFNPYFQAIFVVLNVVCAALCFWSVSQRFSPGLTVVGVACLIGVVQTLCFILSAFQESQPFLPFLSYDVRRHAYLYGRMLGPPQLVLLPITVLLLAVENARRGRGEAA